MATTLDGRLLQAAAQILREGKGVNVIYVGQGGPRECRVLLTDAVVPADTDRVWLVAADNGRHSKYPVHLSSIEVPDATLEELEETLRRLQMERFIARAQQAKRGQRRDRLGRYVDVTHYSEPARCR